MILEFLITVFLILAVLLPAVVIGAGTLAAVFFFTHNYEPTFLPVCGTILAITLGFSLILGYMLTLMHHFP